MLFLNVLDNEQMLEPGPLYWLKRLGCGSQGRFATGPTGRVKCYCLVWYPWILRQWLPVGGRCADAMPLRLDYRSLKCRLTLLLNRREAFDRNPKAGTRWRSPRSKVAKNRSTRCLIIKRRQANRISVEVLDFSCVLAVYHSVSFLRF